MNGATKLERFSAGERFAVDPEAIERELASLWRAAGATTESRNPVTRACLWNVIVHVEERAKLEGAGETEWLTKAVRDLPQYLAARALVLRTGKEEAGAAELESWISANCIVGEGGGKLVCSEEIALAARGDEGERHLPALVRALLVPAVPTAMVFAAVPPAGRPAIESLLEPANRVVSWADRSNHPAPLSRITAVMPDAPLGVIDLGWLSLSSYRTLIAGLFDPPANGEEALIDRVTITATAKLRWSVRLMIAWIASSLGAEGPKAIGEGAWRFSRAGGRPLETVIAEQEDAPQPVIELSASSTKAEYAVRPLQANLAEVTGPHVDAKKVLGRRTEAQLLARALRTRSEDRAFARALQLAGAMS